MSTRTTVVIATYNRSQTYLPATIESVRRQESVPRLLVVDDCSPDDTIGYLSNQPDLDYFSTPGRSERAVTRNLGLAAVESEFVLFLDDDDLLRPGAVRLLEATLDRFPGVAAAIGGWWTTADSLPGPYPLNASRTTSASLWREVLLGWNPATAGQMLFRTSALRDVGGFPTQYPGIDDFVLLLNLAYRSEIAVVPEIVLDYRIHSAQQKQADQTWDGTARREFVTAARAADREEAATLLAARADFLRAMQSRDAEGRAALRRFVRVAPWAVRSPVIGMPVVRLLGSALGEVVLPRRAMTALRARYGHSGKSAT
ncbi:MAG TPA: glycosyltransferase [Mycobacteriales bacterium]|nr:glycosyltransferase [Mycobacteriales bacterium]